MAEVAAHLTDHVIPHVPAGQWVLSLPMRLRPYLTHDPVLVGRILGARSAQEPARGPEDGDDDLGQEHAQARGWEARRTGLQRRAITLAITSRRPNAQLPRTPCPRRRARAAIQAVSRRTLGPYR